MTYNEGDTGAVTTTVRAKLQQTVSVKDFGAVGNGTTNDTNAFNAAIATGKSVYVPSGTYLLSTSVTLPSNTVIYGDGDLSVLYTSLTNPVNIFNSTGGTNNITLRGLKFDGRRKNLSIVIPSPRTRANALVFFGNTDVLSSNLRIESCSFVEAIHFHVAVNKFDAVIVDNVRIYGNGQDSAGGNQLGNIDGVHLTNTINFIVSNCNVLSGDDSVSITSDSSNTSSNGNITNIIANSVLANGVKICGEAGATGGCVDINISGIKFNGLLSGVNLEQVNTETVTRINVSNVVAQQCRNAIFINKLSTGAGVNRVLIDNVNAYLTTEHGIFVNGSSDVLLSNIKTTQSGYSVINFDGIHVQQSTRITVSNFNCFQDSLCGVQFNAVTYSTINNGICTDSGAYTLGSGAGIKLTDCSNVTVGDGVRTRNLNGTIMNIGLQSSGTCTNTVAYGNTENYEGASARISLIGGGNFAPGNANAWAVLSDDGTTLTVQSSYNLNGTPTRNSSGDYLLTWTVGFSGADKYITTGSAALSGITPATLTVNPITQSAGACRVFVTNTSNTRVAANRVYIHAIGAVVTA